MSLRDGVHHVGAHHRVALIFGAFGPQVRGRGGVRRTPLISIVSERLRA